MIIAFLLNLSSSSILIKSFDTLWSQIWQLCETNSTHSTLLCSSKSYMFPLYEAIILGINASEICNKGNHITVAVHSTVKT